MSECRSFSPGIDGASETNNTGNQVIAKLDRIIVLMDRLIQTQEGLMQALVAEGDDDDGPTVAHYLSERAQDAD